MLQINFTHECANCMAILFDIMPLRHSWNRFINVHVLITTHTHTSYNLKNPFFLETKHMA